MSWTFVGSAVGLFETEGSGTLTPVGLLKQTSTASVVLTSVGVLGTSARIQMYFDKQDLSGDADGLDTREIYWLGEHEQTAACVPSGSGSHRDLFLTWIESTPEWVSAAPFTNTDLSLDITIGVVNERLQSGGHPMGNTTADNLRWLLRTTCIPGVKRASAWPYEHRLYGVSGGGTCFFSATIETGDFWVLYKDPSVVRLPRVGGWLMLLTRVRVLVEDVEDEGETLSASDAQKRILADKLSNAGKCLSDIVAFWAPDPSFTVGVKGPFLMVNSLHALDYEHRRAWLGVPGAAVVSAEDTDWLYVYYVVEKHDTIDRTSASAVAELVDPSCDEGSHFEVHEETVTVQTSERVTGDVEGLIENQLITYRTLTRTRSTYGPAFVDPVERGIALRRFTLDTIRTQVRRAGAVPESCWRTDLATCGWSGAVDGENLGLVRLWIADRAGGSRHRVERFESTFQQANGTSPAVADPMPIVCDDGSIALFFAAINGGGPVDTSPLSGHGIWRSASLPDGLSFASAVRDSTGAMLAWRSETAVFGVDFVISTQPASADVYSVDQLVHATPELMYLDPDPVRLPDGSIRVYVGQNSISPDAILELLLLRGDAEDACRSWESAFTWVKRPPGRATVPGTAPPPWVPLPTTRTPLRPTGWTVLAPHPGRAPVTPLSRPDPEHPKDRIAALR